MAFTKNGKGQSLGFVSPPQPKEAQQPKPEPKPTQQTNQR